MSDFSSDESDNEMYDQADGGGRVMGGINLTQCETQISKIVQEHNENSEAIKGKCRVFHWSW